MRAPITSSKFFGFLRMTAKNGLLSEWPAFLTAENNGVSSTWLRITNPIAVRIIPTRKGILHPQLKKSASFSFELNMKTPLPSIRPIGTPACAQLNAMDAHVLREVWKFWDDYEK